MSAEELARIEEKKRRKREEALGIVHEDKPEETENNEAETNKPDTNKEAEGEAKEVKTEDKNDKQEMPKISLNLGGIADEGLGGLGGGLGSGLGEGLGGGLGSGLGSGLGGGLGSVPSEGGLSGKQRTQAVVLALH